MKFLQRFTKNINIAQADRASYRYLSIYNNFVEELSYADARRHYKKKLVFLVPNCSTDFEFILSDFEIEDSDRIISLGLNMKITLFANGANNEKLRDILTNIRTKYDKELAWSSNFVFSQIFKTCEAKLKEIFKPLVDTIESLSIKNLSINDEIKSEVEALLFPFAKVELLDVKVLFREPSDKISTLDVGNDIEVFEEKQRSFKAICKLFMLLIILGALGYLGFEYYKNLKLDDDVSLPISEVPESQGELAKIDIAKPIETEISKVEEAIVDVETPPVAPVVQVPTVVLELPVVVQSPVVQAPVALNEYNLDFYLKSYMNFNDLKAALKSMDFVEYVSGEEVAGGFGSSQARFKIKSTLDKNALKEVLFKAFSLKNKSLKKSDIKLRQ